MGGRGALLTGDCVSVGLSVGHAEPPATDRYLSLQGNTLVSSKQMAACDTC